MAQDTNQLGNGKLKTFSKTTASVMESSHTKTADGIVKDSFQVGPSLTGEGAFKLTAGKDSAGGGLVGKAQAVLKVSTERKLQANQDGVEAKAGVDAFLGAKKEVHGHLHTDVGGWKADQWVTAGMQYGASFQAGGEAAHTKKENTLGGSVALGMLGPSANLRETSQITSPNGSRLTTGLIASPGLAPSVEGGFKASRGEHSTSFEASGALALGAKVGGSLDDKDAPGAAKLASAAMSPMTALTTGVMQHGPKLLGQAVDAVNGWLHRP